MSHFLILLHLIVYFTTKLLSLTSHYHLMINFTFNQIKYPFKKYSNNLCGSTNYTPYNSSKKDNYIWVIRDYVNDWNYNPLQKKYVHYINRYNKDPKLIYKTDIYSMGIVFNQLIHYINEYMKIKNKPEINNRELVILIQNMTHKDIESRYTPIDCVNYLNKFNIL